jgi:integrase
MTSEASVAIVRRPSLRRSPSAVSSETHGRLRSSHPLSEILPSLEELQRMGRPRYQRPSVLKTNAKRPQWYVRVVIDVLADSNRLERKEQAIYLGFCSEMGKREAEKLRDEKLEAINNTPLVVQSQVLMKDLVQAYKEGYLPGLKASTRYDFGYQLDAHILPAFGTLRLCDISSLKVQQWVYHLEDSGLAKSSRRKTLVVLRSVFDAAEEWGYFTGRNPCKKKLLGAGGPVRDLRPLEPSEALRLLHVLTDIQPLGLIVEVALFTGIRVGEVLGLTWGAIDYRRGMIEVRQGRSQQGDLDDPKTPRGRRRLDLGPLVSKLARPKGAKDGDLIWANAYYTTLQKRLRTLAKRVGIEFVGFGFHTLRRTYASWRDELRLAAAPDQGLVRDMGHGSAGMTARYVQSNASGVVERLQNLVYFIEKPKGEVQ